VSSGVMIGSSSEIPGFAHVAAREKTYAAASGAVSRLE
jgi:hypothetical protein